MTSQATGNGVSSEIGGQLGPVGAMYSPVEAITAVTHTKWDFTRWAGRPISIYAQTGDIFFVFTFDDSQTRILGVADGDYVGHTDGFPVDGVGVPLGCGGVWRGVIPKPICTPVWLMICSASEDPVDIRLWRD